MQIFFEALFAFHLAFLVHVHVDDLIINGDLSQLLYFPSDGWVPKLRCL